MAFTLLAKKAIGIHTFYARRSEVSPDDDYVKLEIMGIASRWSLLREGGGASVKGAAKHLAGSLLQELTERCPPWLALYA